jgi:hypothetical protein
MVTTYKELLEKWGDIDRSEMSFEEELSYVEDWYELGKSLPTKPFEPNFTDYAKYKGQNSLFHFAFLLIYIKLKL